MPIHEKVNLLQKTLLIEKSNGISKDIKSRYSIAKLMKTICQDSRFPARFLHCLKSSLVIFNSDALTEAQIEKHHSGNCISRPFSVPLFSLSFSRISNIAHIL